MEVTIGDRRYWKVGEQWFGEITDGQLPLACQCRRFRSLDDNEWDALFSDMIDGNVKDFPKYEFRAPCEDPTAASVVKEGDTVWTALGMGRVIPYAKSGQITPVIKPEPIRAVATGVKEGDVIQSPKTPRTTRIDYPLNTEMLSRLGPVILLPVDNAPDFGFFALILKSVAEDPENALYSFVTLHDGMTWRVRATVDEVNDKVVEAWSKCEPIDPVDKPSTITLRDQLAMASLPALIQKYSGQDRFTLSATDRLTMCREVYLIADEMLKTSGPQ